MKKAVILIVTISYIITLYVSFLHYRNEQLLDFAVMENESGHPFVIPEDIILESEELHSILYHSANAADVNLFRSARNFRPDEKIEYIKYVLLVTDSELFRHFRVTEGHLPSNNAAKIYDINLSAKEKNQEIGVVQSFSADIDLLVKPLWLSFGELEWGDRYFIEYEGAESREMFFKELIEGLNHAMGDADSIHLSELQPEEAFTPLNEELIILHDLSLISMISSIVFAIAFMLFLYYLFSQTKRSAIMEMHGIAFFRIWWGVVGKIITVPLILAGLSILSFTTFSGISLVYLPGMLIPISISYLILFTSSWVCYFMILRVSVSDMLKKRKHTGFVTAMNSIAKVVIGMLILLGSMETFQYHSAYKEDIDLLRNTDGQNEWEDVKHTYGVFEFFMGFIAAHNFEELEREFLQRDHALATLYPPLNERGAILVDASMYESENIRLNQHYQGILSMTVNVNYLNEYPILGSNGGLIGVSEDEDRWLLLIPEQYSHEEEEIIEFYDRSRDFYVADNEDIEIKIIWTQEGQRSFAMNPEVFPQVGNYVVDPVIQVKTNSNQLNIYSGGMKGNGLGDPLKVYLGNNKADAVYNQLQPTLEKLQLEGNTKISSVEAYIQDRIQNQTSNLKINMVSLMALFLVYTAISMQHAIIHFHKHAKKLVILDIFGVGFFSKYASLFLKNISIFLFTVTLSLLVNNQRLFTSTDLIANGQEVHFLIITAILFLIEVSTTVISVIRQGKSKRVEVLKSEI